VFFVFESKRISIFSYFRIEKIDLAIFGLIYIQLRKLKFHTYVWLTVLAVLGQYYVLSKIFKHSFNKNRPYRDVLLVSGISAPNSSIRFW